MRLPAQHRRRVPVPLALAAAGTLLLVACGIRSVRAVAAPPALTFADTQDELDVDALVRDVLQRNPSLAQMQAAYEAAAARYSQVTSLDDPMLTTMVAPASIRSRDVDFGYRIELSQKFPFPGKRRLRGAQAAAEAEAACQDVASMRLQLIESTKAAAADYYLAERTLAVNEEGLVLLRDFLRNAETRYRTGLVPQQDVLQAEVEIARQEERQLTLKRQRQVAIARINTLLHQPPDAPLPPPPQGLASPTVTRDAAAIRALALSRRPELLALAERVRAQEGALGLAQKEFRPDVELTAAYDTIMGNGPARDLAPQVGLRINLPVRRAKRYGALAEAQARIAERQEALSKQVDDVGFEVQQAYEQVQESAAALRLYAERILPAAEASVRAAQSAYVTARTPFLTLIEAQRTVVLLREQREETIAEAFRRQAALERAAGGPFPP